jgi:hypothetical protein
MIAELDVRAIGLRLTMMAVCALPVHACGGDDVEVETPTQERQTVSASDEVVESLGSPTEWLIYDQPVNLAKPAPVDSVPRPADTTQAARDTIR